MKPYPNPCDACGRVNCTYYRDCGQYLKYVRTIWKQFNHYPIRAYRKFKNKKSEKFCYEHPDIVRRYLEKGPCEKCPKAKDCEIPCFAYWCWWDARREWHRRRLGR